MPRLISARRIISNRIYTPTEAADLLGVWPSVVHKWIREDGLPAQRDHRPSLIIGADIKRFLRERKARKYKPCKIDEFYCCSCHEPRRPAFDEVEIAKYISNGAAHLRAICPVCSTIMNLARSRAQIAAMREIFKITSCVPKTD